MRETVNPSALELSPEAREFTALGLAPLPVESRRLNSVLDPEKLLGDSQVLLLTVTSDGESRSAICAWESPSATSFKTSGSLEAVMNSNRNGLGSRKTEGCARPSQPENPHSSAVFTQVHNSL